MVGLLLVSLVLTGIVAAHALRLQRTNAEVANAVLRDYAALAGDEFGRRLIVELGYRNYFPRVQALGGNDVRVLQAGAVDDALVCGYIELGPVTTFNGCPGAGEFVQEIAAQIRRGASWSGPFRVLRGTDPVQQAIVRHNDDGVVAGFVVDHTGIASVIAAAIESGPLLPASIGGGDIGNEQLYLGLRGPDGTLLFEQRSDAPPAGTVTRAVGDAYQGILADFEIEAALERDTASSLIIGGLPASRVPLVILAMLLIIGLTVAAAWLLRREQALVAMRSDFVSQVSHELRTPLTQIRLFAETLLLDRAPDPAGRRRALEVINREAQRLGQLVDNVLRFSVRGSEEPADTGDRVLRALVEEVAAHCRPLYPDTIIDVHGAPGVQARVDADALRQVILNLIDNAAKYGPAGQTISLAIAARGSKALLIVSDSGPGIPAAEHDKVFQPFYRLQRDRRAATSGTGIGLAVVHDLVTAMGGQCRIESDNGGTSVVIEFARADDDAD